MPIKILFVDDEERLRDTTKKILKSHGYEVLCAKDGFDGLAAMEESFPDLIISDLHMPNMNGFEFLSVIRQRFPQLAVIVISGTLTGVDVFNHALADVFFEKSQYTPNQLIARIDDLTREAQTRPSARKPNAPPWIPHEQSKHIA